MKSVLLILFISLNDCQAQLPKYYVYLVHGDAELLKAGAKPVTVKQNIFVFTGNTLSLNKNAEVTLVDNDGKFIVLHIPGNYKIRDIANNNRTKKPDDVTLKYLKLLWNELLNPELDYAKFKQKNIAGVYGGVDRSLPGSTCKNLIFPVNGLKTAEKSLHFRWRQTSGSSTYRFIIYNDSKAEVVNLPVRDTQTIVNSVSSMPGKYYWLVKGEPPGCENEVPVYFKIISMQEEEKITAAFWALKSDDVSGQLRIINKMERDSLILAAINAYQSGVNANPSNVALFKSYELFLLKYGFEEEAYRLWINHFRS